MQFHLLALGLVVAGSVTVAGATGDLFLTNARQLTFDGRRAGEGYFSADGRRMVFQSERDPANPFFQMFVLDLGTGDLTRVSTGRGKTTCGWLAPGGDRVWFASTHEDSGSETHQQRELSARATGKMRRYSWDYDEHFDIFEARIDGSGLRNLTRTRGYDAEGAASPDGQWIVFASNRAAYDRPLGASDAKRLEIDKSYFIDLYMMRADGSDVRRLTDVPGYDGGPFFSADGKRICWRRFNESGEKAEIWTMNADGTDARALTRLGALSWAPFFHPSGKYLVFSTNLSGFDNFELYLVDADGRRDPVRVTVTPGFDSLASFSPDGKRISWTSNRSADGTSQIFVADWDHAQAVKALGLATDGPSVAGVKEPDTAAFSPAITPADVRRHVDFLASEPLAGRLTGTEGEVRATQYAADVFQALGLEPAGGDGSWFLPFEFTAGVELGAGNVLTAGDDALAIDRNWRPLSFSATGPVAPSGVVMAGYGIEMAEEGREAGYSSYAHLDVKDRWVMVFRYLPERATGEMRTRLTQHASLRRKAMVARERGARGIIFVSGSNASVREQLVPLAFDAALSGSGLAALSVTDAVAARWIEKPERSLKSLQDELDKAEPVSGFAIDGLVVSATIDLAQEKRTGRNVLARVRRGAIEAAAAPDGGDAARREPAPRPALLIGAHIDHLGREAGGNSRATESERGQFHPGADDNASGVAGLFEIAQYLSAESAAGRLALERDVIFAAWSGEEAGLLGSSAYASRLARLDGDDRLGDNLCAVLNMDMIGRLTKSLVLQGLGSSDVWKPLIEKRNVPIGLPLTLQSDCFAPTDTTTFYPKGVPILNAFTGSHEDYHRPSDTPDKVNFEGAARVARLMAAVAADLAARSDEPEWREFKSSAGQGQRTAMRVYLGTIPDYSQGDVPGVKLSGVSPVGPAAKAGLRGGDLIVSLAGRGVKNIYDYTFLMGELKVGMETEVGIVRDGARQVLKITPISRD